MAHISCDVKKCEYNKNGGCMLNRINVGTQAAKISEQTMCESYAPSGKGAKNSCGCRSDACEIAEICCSAEKCSYNDNGKCEAKKVEISPCNTCSHGETECNTFKAQ